MIFRKDKHSLENETIERWRKVSSAAQEEKRAEEVHIPTREMFLNELPPEATQESPVLMGELRPERDPLDVQETVSIPLEEDLKRRFGNNIKSALGPGTVIEGKFRFESPVRIDGTLTGEVFSDSVLIVGAEARVEAKINVGSLIVLGQVKGEIVAEDLIEILHSGTIEGDITSARLAIEDGGRYQGHCQMVCSGEVVRQKGS